MSAAQKQGRGEPASEERPLTWEERREVRNAYQRERLRGLRAGLLLEQANERGRLARAEVRREKLSQIDVWAERDERACKRFAEITGRAISRFEVVHRPEAGAWYDWIDLDSGAYGQCQRNPSGVGWAQAPRGAAPVILAYVGGTAARILGDHSEEKGT